jgi:predicted transcriptional regulator
MPTPDRPSIKPDARKLVERLPDDATWDDLQYQISVRQSIEAGLADLDAGRVVPVAEVRRRLGLPMPSVSV